MFLQVVESDNDNVASHDGSRNVHNTSRSKLKAQVGVRCVDKFSRLLEDFVNRELTGSSSSVES